MSIVLPPWLKSGDRAVVVCPSSAPGDLTAGLAVWQQWGLTVDVDLPAEASELTYLAGSDCARLQSLQAALDAEDVAAIIFGRGGYGATRLLAELTWAGFQRHPKWLVGFSDSTALLWSALKAGVASVHAPLLSTIASEPEASRTHLWRWLSSGKWLPLPGEIWYPGNVSGLLLPANLTVATALLGTPYWPQLDVPVILALEDINEEAYRLDRMLTQWRQAGVLANVVGIVLGRFSWTESDAMPDDPLPSLRDRLLDLGIPVVAELPFGHAGSNYALPVGLWALLEGGCLWCGDLLN